MSYYICWCSQFEEGDNLPPEDSIKILKTDLFFPTKPNDQEAVEKAASIMYYDHDGWDWMEKTPDLKFGVLKYDENDNPVGEISYFEINMEYEIDFFASEIGCEEDD
jgi:hypothetical protein